MARPSIACPSVERSKWLGYVLVLLMPGSFVILPALWIVRLCGVEVRCAWRSRSKSRVFRKPAD